MKRKKHPRIVEVPAEIKKLIIAPPTTMGGRVNSSHELLFFELDIRTMDKDDSELYFSACVYGKTLIEYLSTRVRIIHK